MRAVIAFSVLVANVATAESPARFELSLSPVSVQLNGKLVEHIGTFGTATWFPHERVGVQLTVGGNWFAQESAFTREFEQNYGLALADSVAWTWAAFAGLEVEPVSGAFRVFDGAPVRFGLTLGGGFGPGGTRHFASPGRSVDTGVRVMSLVSFGLKAVVAERVTLRVGLRNVMHSSVIKTLNGCSVDDVRSHAPGSPFGYSIRGAPTCDTFVRDVDPVFVPDLLRRSEPTTVNNVQFAVSVGVLF